MKSMDGDANYNEYYNSIYNKMLHNTWILNYRKQYDNNKNIHEDIWRNEEIQTFNLSGKNMKHMKTN